MPEFFTYLKRVVGPTGPTGPGTGTGTGAGTGAGFAFGSQLSGSLGCAEGGDDNAGFCPYGLDQKSACTTIRLSRTLAGLAVEAPHVAKQLDLAGA
jgi:hypothetical protein